MDRKRRLVSAHSTKKTRGLRGNSSNFDRAVTNDYNQENLDVDLDQSMTQTKYGNLTPG